MIELKEVDVTIALATRGRALPLRRLLDSIIRTTTSLKRIEVFLGMDYCDPVLFEAIRIAEQYPFRVSVLIQPRSQNISDDYLNRMFSMARGRWLWVMNDDVEIVTQGWDDKLRNRPDFLHSGPLCLDTKDNTRNFNNNGEFACFPMINHHAFKAMGCFFFPFIPTWGADKWLNKVCSEAGIVRPAFELELFHHMDADDDAHKHMENGIRKHGCRDGWEFGETVQALKEYTS